jgi:hypothetical protein
VDVVRMMRARWTLAAGLATLLMFGEAKAADSPSQYDVQAVYLFDFAKFVRWPAGVPDSSVDICVAGQAVYVDSLKKIVVGEKIDGKPLKARAVDRPEQEAGCGILFIGISAKDRADGLMAAALGKPILTVSDIPGFLSHGGMIEFMVLDKRVRFAVDLRASQKSGIGLNSALLKVAVKVDGTPGGGEL